MLERTKYIHQQRLHKYMTLVLDGLKRKGYQLKFRREPECIYCLDWNQWILPAQFTVDELYYFVEPVTPDANRKLYAISLSQGGKGYLIDAVNIYTDNISPEMFKKLNL